MSIIEISGVTKTFGKKTALNDVSLSINSGEIFGFLGPNGAGKSTTIRCIMGSIFPDSGTIEINKLPVDRSHAQYREYVGYVPSDLQLNEKWSGDDHISFFRSLRKNKRDIANDISRLSLDTTEHVKHLSTGNKQKLAFLLALMAQPKVLILDEPTKGLDPILQETMYEMLLEFKENGGCVFFSSHNLSEVERISDRIGIIRAGKIVANETMETLREKHVHIAKVVVADNENLPDVSSFGEVSSQTSNSLTIRIEGDLNAFMHAISQVHVLDLTIEHANLEDVFMRFYEEKK